MLTTLQIKAATATDKTYRLADGHSLFLVVRPSGVKSFEFRYKRGGKVNAIVLGKFSDAFGLSKARAERDQLRTLLAAGKDPAKQKEIAAKLEDEQLEAVRAAAAVRRIQQSAARNEAARAALTFQKVAEHWIAHNRPDWRDRHADQVEQSMRDHVYPTLGARSIDAIEPAHVLELVGDLLAEGKVETARRVRQRLDAVFSYAALVHKVGVNPVAISRKELTKRFKVAAKANPALNFPCVPAKELPQLLRAMRAYVGTPTTRTLLWLVALTACRTAEARFATWDEIDLEGGTWTIPAARMKAGKEHTVYLSRQAVALLQALQPEPGAEGFVFPHPRRHDRPASENAILYALAAIGYKDRMSGHGFRHVFSTLCNEAQRNRDAIETSLAHGDADPIRATYNRAQWADVRRELMQWYADELARLEAGTAAKVVALRGR